MQMDSVLMDGWFSLTLVQQMINIGNEVKRAVRFDENAEKKHAFLVKAIQYTDLSMQDPKNQGVLPELDITRKVLLDYDGEEHKLDYSKEQLRDYYMNYTLR